MKTHVKEAIKIMVLSTALCFLLQAAMFAFLAPYHLKQAIIDSITQ